MHRQQNEEDLRRLRRLIELGIHRMKLFDRVGASWILIFAMGCGVVILVFVYILAQINATSRVSRARAANDLAGCMSETIKHVDGGKVTRASDAVTFSFELCRNIVLFGLTADEQIIRNETFVLQRDQNAAILTLVVAITLGGVLLSALQLLASYKISMKHVGGSTNETQEISINKDSLSIKSSYVGVAIFGISLAFYVVFVLFVYEPREFKPSIAASALSAPGDSAAANRGTVLSEPERTPPEPAAPSTP